MIDANTVHDLRVTLNGAQDSGKEALVWMKRVPVCSEEDFPFFEAQAVAHATAAFTQARLCAMYAARFTATVEEL